MNTNHVTEAAVATYHADPAHSSVRFKVRHLGFSKVTGRFGAFDATVRLDPGDLTTLEAEATIDAASISTGDEKRDAHLRSEDFFEVETYPELTFRSTGVRNVRGDDFELEGELTMHGVTKPVVLAGTFLGTARDPWGGERVGFEAQTTINRKDFGLNWNSVLETGGVLVGEDVEIVLDVQAVQQDG